MTRALLGAIVTDTSRAIIEINRFPICNKGNGVKEGNTKQLKTLLSKIDGSIVIIVTLGSMPSAIDSEVSL